MKKIHMATFGAPHGVRGLIRLQSFTETPEDILSYQPLFDKDNNSYQLSLVRIEPPKTLIVSLENIKDRTAADSLKGTKLFVDREMFPELEEDAFYYSDLIGMTVNDGEGNVIGVIKDVANYGAGDILEIQSQDGIKSIIFTKEAVPNVDTEHRIVTISLSFLLEN